MSFGVFNEGDEVTIKDECMYEYIRGSTAVILGKGISKHTFICWFEDMAKNGAVSKYGTKLHSCEMIEDKYKGKCLYIHVNDLEIGGFWGLQ